MAERDPMLSRAQRWAVGGIALAAGCLLAYGVAGSYTSVTHLASAHGVPLPRLVPVGIDGGLIGTVLLDIVLTWTGFPVWWLRWLARILTAGMIAANGAAGWPDPVPTGLHLAAPVMILAVIEAARSVLLRRPAPGEDRREPIPLARWILAPWPTWKLWRRMVLWEVTSYRAAIETEQRRLRALYQLRSRYGSSWERQVPDDLAWMLRSGVLPDDAFTRVAELTGAHRPPADGGQAELPRQTDDELIADMRTRWPEHRPSREAVLRQPDNQVLRPDRHGRPGSGRRPQFRPYGPRAGGTRPPPRNDGRRGPSAISAGAMSWYWLQASPSTWAASWELSLLPSRPASEKHASREATVPDAENPHIGGVHDADEEPGIPGSVVGQVPVPVGEVPDSRRIFGAGSLRAGGSRERRGRLSRPGPWSAAGRGSAR